MCGQITRADRRFARSGYTYYTLDDQWFNCPLDGVQYDNARNDRIHAHDNSRRKCRSRKSILPGYALKRQVVHYAFGLTRGYYAKWNEVSCASAPDSGALVFSIRHVVSEYHDKNGNLYMTIAHIDRIPVDQIGNIDPNREAQWGQYEDGPIDQGQ